MGEATRRNETQRYTKQTTKGNGEAYLRRNEQGILDLRGTVGRTTPSWSSLSRSLSILYTHLIPAQLGRGFDLFDHTSNGIDDGNQDYAFACGHVHGFYVDGFLDKRLADDAE